MKIDNGFSFDGRHCLSDFGLICVKDEERTLTAPAEVVAYTIGGIQGTKAFGEHRIMQAYPMTVTLYADREMGSETDLTQLWRRAIAWLTSGRKQLIWDSEPDVYAMAEATEITGSVKDWIEEGMQVTWLIQPELHSIRPDRLSMNVQDNGWHDGILRINTCDPAPVSVCVAPEGSARLSSINVSVDGKQVLLTGLEAVAGDAVRIEMQTPIGAEIIHADGSKENALPHALVFDRLTGDGSTAVAVMLGGQSPAAQVTFEAWGVWH